MEAVAGRPGGDKERTWDCSIAFFFSLFFFPVFTWDQHDCEIIVAGIIFRRTQGSVSSSHSGGSSTHFSLEMAFVSPILLSPSRPGELKLGSGICTCCSRVTRQETSSLCRKAGGILIFLL